MILTALLAASLTARLMAIDEVRVSDGALRLGDVVQVDAGSQLNLGPIVIAKLPRGVSEIQLSRANLQLLAQRAVPGLQFSETADGHVTIRQQAIAVIRAAPCYEAARPLAVGEAFAIEDVMAATCDRERMKAALRYDPKTAATVAVQAVNAGDYLGNVNLGSSVSVRRGDKLTLNSRAGPVVIERPVVAMQGVKPTERRLFVQTDDGAIFATDLVMERAR